MGIIGRLVDTFSSLCCRVVSSSERGVITEEKLYWFFLHKSGNSKFIFSLFSIFFPTLSLFHLFFYFLQQYDHHTYTTCQPLFPLLCQVCAPWRLNLTLLWWRSTVRQTWKAAWRAGRSLESAGRMMMVKCTAQRSDYVTWFFLFMSFIFNVGNNAENKGK